MKPITIIGAGLVGSLLAILLARRGFSVTLFEQRPDPRRAGFLGGRSINLALSERGLHALRMADLDQSVLAQAVMMRGRIVHDGHGNTNLQRYGINDTEVNWSVSRGVLNLLLLDAAEAAGVRIECEQALADVNFDQRRISLRDRTGALHQTGFEVILGADGAGSSLRRAMHQATDLGERVAHLDHGYRELEIPALPELTDAHLDAAQRQARAAGERFAIAAEGLHIWPRGNRMCIALPNHDGSFTVTLFLRCAGAHPSFETLPNATAARAYFQAEYADVLALIPRFDADWTQHPVGSLSTLHLDRWHVRGQALLLGDAAHAIVPFHGQGMNAGFEDVAILAPLLAEGGDLAEVFAQFQHQRKPDADAIATMALENYVEMRDSVVDPDYLRKRQLAAALADRAPDHFMPRYRMVTFTHLPYAWCLQRGRDQNALLERLLQGSEPIERMDLDAAVATLRRELPPLPA